MREEEDEEEEEHRRKSIIKLKLRSAPGACIANASDFAALVNAVLAFAWAMMSPYLLERSHNRDYTKQDTQEKKPLTATVAVKVIRIFDDDAFLLSLPSCAQPRRRRKGPAQSMGHRCSLSQKRQPRFEIPRDGSWLMHMYILRLVACISHMYSEHFLQVLAAVASLAALPLACRELDMCVPGSEYCSLAV